MYLYSKDKTISMSNYVDCVNIVTGMNRPVQVNFMADEKVSAGKNASECMADDQTFQSWVFVKNLFSTVACLERAARSSVMSAAEERGRVHDVKAVEAVWKYQKLHDAIFFGSPLYLRGTERLEEDCRKLLDGLFHLWSFCEPSMTAERFQNLIDQAYGRLVSERKNYMVEKTA